MSRIVLVGFVALLLGGSAILLQVKKETVPSIEKAVLQVAETDNSKGAGADTDQELLASRGIGSDGPALLDYLRKLSPKELDPPDFDVLIDQLGDANFVKRDQASKRLAAFDLVPFGLLFDAMNRGDLEVARRARDLIEKQAKNQDWFLPLAAVRLLAKQRPSGTLKVLLRYLPFATWEDLIEEIWYAIDALALQNDKTDPLLEGALKDPAPARRAVAACIIGRIGNAAQRGEARKLLSDPNALVRLRAAQGLLAAHDKAGIPVLVDLLNQPSPEISWQAEELLHWFAGDGAPKETVGAATQRERKDCSGAWKRWLSALDANADIGTFQRLHRRPGLLLICEKEYIKNPGSKFGTDETSRIWLCGCDGEPRWELRNLQEHVFGFQLLSPNHIFLARQLHLPGDDFPQQIFQISSLSAKPRYERQFKGGLVHFQAFPNGVTALVDFQDVVLISGVKGEVGRFSLGNNPEANRFFTSYGYSLLFSRETTVSDTIPHRISQIDLSTGRVVNTFPLQRQSIASLNITTGGNLLIGFRDPDKTCEFTINGRRVAWPFEVDSTRCPVKLRTGDLILAREAEKGTRITARDSNGKVFWEAFSRSHEVDEIRPCYRLVQFGFSLDKLDLDSVSYRVATLERNRDLINRASLARFWSFEFLGKLGPKAKAAVPVLIDMLSEPSDEAQHQALRTLVQVGPVSLTDVSKLLGNKESRLRIAATKILGYYSLKENKLLSAFRTAMDDPDPSVREAFFYCLGWLKGHPKEVLELLSQGLRDKNVKVKESVITALERQGSAAKPLAPQLLRILNGSEKDLHQSSARALGAIAADDKAVLKALTEALQNKASLAAQLGAAEAFVCIGPSGSDVIPILVQIVREGPKNQPPKLSRLQGTALSALAKMGPKAKAVLPTVIEILRDPSYPLDDRIGASQTIGEIGVRHKEAIDALKEIESNETEEPSLRMSTTLSLTRLRKEN